MSVNTFWSSQYGFRSRSIVRLSNDLANILQIEWQIRDSEALGEYFLYPPFQPQRDNSQRESFQLFLNRTSWLEGWKNRDYKQYQVLMNSTSKRPLEIDALLFLQMDKGIALLKRRLTKT